MQPSPPGAIGRRALRRGVTAALILLAIAYLTIFGLVLAERGRKGLPAEPLQVAGEALTQTGAYIVQHPATYYWHKQQVPALNLVLTSFVRSAGLLVLALLTATAIGVPFGVLAATRRRGAPVVLLTSTLGISTPSFLLAMLLWVLALRVNTRLGIAPLPSVGFGWDRHAILPILVLAARPLAQIVQVTHVTLSQVLAEDYVRTARSKGLSERLVLLQHALRNVRIPLLITIGTSLRFVLASLVVVELFFGWPGLGLTLLQAIEAGTLYLVVDLTVALGLLFLLLNLLFDILYPLLDPRLSNGNAHEQSDDQASLREIWGGVISALARNLSQPRRKDSKAIEIKGNPDDRHDLLADRPTRAPRRAHFAWTPRRGRLWTRRDADLRGDPETEGREHTARPGNEERRASRSHYLHATIGNLPLLLGSLMVLGLLVLAIVGSQLAKASPYETHGIIMIANKPAVPPYRPTGAFPWGSDPVGRDIQALVLGGARRTITLALFAALARLILGGALGGLAGWWQNGRFDRVIGGGVAVWAAFPATIFAAILIQGLGIQQGMWVFVVALCIVGWGEIAQFVRGQVLAIKAQPYVESARAVGGRSDQILLRHVLPNLLPSLVVLGILEVAGVLMLLAELGFLNIFMGGGFRAEITAGANSTGQVYYFSDVPEWGALLANIRIWWRTYPWLAWYPGIFFFGAILAFNLWGVGLRRFLEETRFNVNRLFNRYALFGVILSVGILAYVLQATAPLGLYRDEARQFDAQRALGDIQALSSAQFAGRETGTPGAKQAADYIARRMQEVGLFPGGEHNTFVQTYPCPRLHLADTPGLAIEDDLDQPAALAYRTDFADYQDRLPTYGQASGPVLGVALGPLPAVTGADPYHLSPIQELGGKILLMREDRAWLASPSAAAGRLLITSDPARLQQRRLFRREASPTVVSTASKPVMYVSEAVADRLLGDMGTSLADFDRTLADLGAGEVALSPAGPAATMSIPVQPETEEGEDCYNVIGYIPGIGALQSVSGGRGLDSKVIMLSAYYDGLGTAPDGTLYPSANDNASAVAALLEMGRVLKNGQYLPQKTVVFVAWAEGERGKPLLVSDMMNAKVGFSTLQPEAVIELSGLAGGHGDGLALGQGSSYRLVQLLQKAAGRMGVRTTTRGRDPHYGLPPAAAAGSRSALTAYVSWDGSEALAHTPQDDFQAIDRAKLRASGQALTLAVTVLSREVNY